MTTLRPALLNRYREIALLLFRHFDRDLLEGGELTEVLDAEDRDRLREGEPSKPEALVRDLEELGPTFVKLGQLLSTRADLLPERYLEALARLQDGVEPFSFDEVEEIVSEELGVRLSAAFSTFESKPLAAASLAQVHRGALRDGRPVVVKVQRPGIREEVGLDLEALETIAGWVAKVSDTARRYRVEEIVEEFRRTLTRELDLLQERANLHRMADSLASFEKIVIPRPVDDFTTSRVLTMDYVEGASMGSMSPVVHTEIDGEELAGELFRAYLRQVLVLGTFHADPHPGNVLLTRDHRVGLLDLGMVGHLRKDQQDAILRLLLAISQGDAEGVADVTLSVAERTEDCTEDDFRQQIGNFVMDHSGARLQELQLGSLLIEICRIAASNGVLLPPAFSLLAKTLLNLDQIGESLDPDFDPTAAFRAYADELLSQKLGEESNKEKLLSSLWEAKELVEAMPSRANRILETLAANELRIQVDAIDEERLTRSVEKVANRITIGLVLAALIVGASMLMRVDTPFKIFGYPGLAMIFFVLAAAGALWQVWTIFRESGKS